MTDTHKDDDAALIELKPCPYCTRKFAGQNAVWMHAKAKHAGKKVKHLRPARAPEDESYADFFIKAQQDIAAGEPVEGWIRDMML